MKDKCTPDDSADCEYPDCTVGKQAAPAPQDGDERARFVAWHKDKFGWYGEDVDACKDRFTIWQAALASNKAAAVAVGPNPRKELAKSVFGGINALRWLLNITTEFDRKDVRTRQAARLLDECGDKNGRMNRHYLEHLWKTLYDELSLDDTLECLRARDAAPTPTVAADAATPPAPIASAEEAALRDAVAYLNGNLPDGPIDQLRKARAIAAVMQAAAHPAGAQPSTSTEESVPKPKPLEKRPITEEWRMNMARLEGDSEIGACNPLKYPRIFVDSAIPGDPIEMALCSTEQVFLKPNQLYRFYVKESCAECSRIADPVAALVTSSSEAIGWTTQFDLDCVNRGETGVIFKHKDQADSNIALYTHPAAAQPSED
jgi:hypothetical protein